MMKENKVDKLFKAKASQGNFAFDEANWAAAEKMLDAQATGATGGGFKLGLMTGLIVAIASLTASLVWLNPTEKIKDPLATEVFATEERKQDLENAEPTKGSTTTHSETSTSINETLATDQNNSRGNITNQPEPVKSDVDYNPVIKPVKEPILEKTNVSASNESTPALVGVSKAPKESGVQTERKKTMATSNENGMNENTALTETEQPAKSTSTSTENDDNGGLVGYTAAAMVSKNPGSSLSSKTNQEAGRETMNGSASLSASALGADAVPPTESTTNQPVDQAKQSTKGDSFVSPKATDEPAETSASAGESALAAEETNAESEEDIEPFNWTDNFTYGIGAEFGYYFNQRQLTSPMGAYETFRNTNETQNGSLSGGLSFQLGYRNWTLNTGIYQYTIRETVSYPSSVPTPVGVNQSYWANFEVWNHSIDSTWVIKGVNQGGWNIDTNWTVHEDSIYVEQWDTAFVNKEDPKLAANNGVKTISYAEIPILFGRSFKMNKVVLDIQAGMTFGFLTKVEGSQYINANFTDLETINQVDQFNSVLYSGMLRAGIRFGLSRNLEAGLYPSLRYTFNSVLKGNYGDQRYLGYGLQFGLYYRL